VSYVLAIDQGTSGSTVLAVAEDGWNRAVVTAPYWAGHR
jgi:sugar (pentulose or hexulose) kinase